MHKISDILKKFNPTKDMYISREFQSFGVHLSEKLGDERNKSLYIKMAKNYPRVVLEKALSFVSDSNARNKAALFMWKLKELGAFQYMQKTMKANNVPKVKNKNKKKKKVFQEKLF